MELDKRMEIDEARLNKIRLSLTRVLTASEENIVKVTRAASRQVRVFKTTTNVAFSENPVDGQTVMELVAADGPGLLSKVGRVFLEQEVNIAAAKIMTIGERAEDVFYICNRDGSRLNTNAQRKLRDGIVSILESE